MRTEQTVSPLHPSFATRRAARFFTLERARCALPLVRRITTDIVDQHRYVCELEDRCHQSGAASNDNALRERYAAALDRLRDLIDELAAVGCELRDWRRGIVDFPAYHEGRRIEFCWRLGEADITHWHDPDAGFCGRRDVTELQVPQRSMTA